jgi:hypothetical protein
MNTGTITPQTPISTYTPGVGSGISTPGSGTPAWSGRKKKSSLLIPGLLVAGGGLLVVYGLMGHEN